MELERPLGVAAENAKHIQMQTGTRVETNVREAKIITAAVEVSSWATWQSYILTLQDRFPEEISIVVVQQDQLNESVQRRP